MIKRVILNEKIQEVKTASGSKYICPLCHCEWKKADNAVRCYLRCYDATENKK